MVSIRGEEIGPILKPTPKPKGGRKPKNAGRRYERVFADKYGGKRVVGSGAFGVVDPVLVGDVAVRVGELDMLMELKSLNQLNGRGERIVSFPLSWIEKIDREARSIGKIPGFIYHPKGSSDEYIVLNFAWFKELMEDYKRQIDELNKRDPFVDWVGGIKQ